VCVEDEGDEEESVNWETCYSTSQSSILAQYI